MNHPATSIPAEDRILPSPFRADHWPKSLSRILILTIFLGSSGFSQTGWETTAGGPVVENSPLCVTVIDSLYAVMAGRAGKIFRTTDGGDTWIASPSGSTEAFDDISFSDRYRGTVVGSTHTTILRTRDGGVTWQRQSVAETDSIIAVNSVSFSDSVNGALVTLNGRIYHTSNGGENWVIASPPLFRDLQRIRLRRSYGLAVGYMGDTYRTSDGGRSWFYHSAQTGGRALRDVSLIDSLTAIAVGDGGTIQRSSDGGILWTAVPSEVNTDLRSVTFFDELNGIIGTLDGTLLRTSDGGISWSAPQATPMSAIGSLAFYSPAFGLAVSGVDGNIFRSGDRGTTWDAIEYSWRGSFYGVCALNPDSFFGVGEGGRIAFSPDYGNSWQSQSGPTTATLRDVSFHTPLDGWVVGDSGVILHTSNGGSDWVRQQGGTAENLFGVSHPDPGVAIACGENNTLLRTTNGGISWTARSSPIFDHWQAISFVSAEEGAAAGRDGSIIRTTDGGESWRLVRSLLSAEDIEYPEAGHIYAVGRVAGDSLHGLSISTDGGNSWTGHILSGWKLTGVSFADRGIGAVAGIGGVISTQDSGFTWTSHNLSESPFHAIASAGQGAAIALGDSGVTARLRNAGSIEGVWFHDLNSDSLRNSGEEGLAGRTVWIDGPFTDSVITGPDGRYVFTGLPYGSYIVRPQSRLFWEQITPRLFTTDTLSISFQSEQVRYRDIGFSGPHVRLRIPVQVSDRTNFAHRIVWCGIRPGTTTGIWGVYPRASDADSLEEEFELPPRSFVEFAGIFDARFSDPHVPLNEYSEIFGEGSWTDMRPYFSPAQRDTFLVSFLPGYIFGGSYPMTLRWSREIISQSFGGPVSLVEQFGASTDMKTTESLTLTNFNVESLLLVTDSPNFPDAWLTRWRLLSLPAPVADGSISTLFPSASTRGYSFHPTMGYEVHDTLRPNTGYWLKYPPALDTLLFDSTARQRDSIRLFTGWNLIGALSVPIAVTSITTDPASLSLGDFFSFEAGYTVTDSLIPGGGYWVHSDREGTIYLDAGLPKGITGSSPRSEFEQTLSDLAAIRVEDANSHASMLYLSDHDSVDVKKYLLPPYPPAGVYDVRYGSQRLVEAVKGGSVTEYQVFISSARFPLRISLSRETFFPVSARVGGKVVPMGRGGTITIYDERDLEKTEQGQRYVLTLMIAGRPGIPAEFALMQNYPNPFNSSTLIPFSVPTSSRIKIRIFDIIGREVALLFDDIAGAGYGSVRWDAGVVASGVYFYRMDAVSLTGLRQSFSDVRKLVVIR